jgi:hypothetical protein
MKRISMVLIFLLVVLSLMPTHFVLAGNGITEAPNQKPCTGSWQFPMLYVGGKDQTVFAQAEYKFDENCRPYLANKVELNYLPDSILHPSQQPVGSTTVQAETVFPVNFPDKFNDGENSILTVNTCHLNTLERDIIHLNMIAVQTDQPYSWNNITVTLSGGSTTSARYYNWWYQGSGPHMTNGYTSSQVAWAKGDSSYYCMGGPFCGGTPAYNITLYNNMVVDYQGGCGGYGTYSGTIVPAGSVVYSVWK